MEWKKYWPLLVVVLLVVFFYPKECGNWGTSMTATYDECGCIGLKTSGFAPPGGGPYYCFGFCHNCRCVQNEIKDSVRVRVPCETGIVCFNLNEYPNYYRIVPLETVKEYAPANLSEIVNNGRVEACVNYDLLHAEPRAICEACGWICAIDSPFFWKFTENGEELEVYLWDVSCGGDGLEYRLPGQKMKEGYKVMIGESE